MIRYTAPAEMPIVYPYAVIHLYAGTELVGECTITFKSIEPKPEPLESEILSKEPEPEPEPQEEEIIEPHDCCADPDRPDEPLKIEPTSIRAGPNQPVIIGIKKLWRDCDDGCYKWQIAHGGGKLLCACGKQAIYLTPSLNRMCEANATIELICTDQVVATCHVTINTWGEREPAYITYDRDLHFTFEFWDAPWAGEHGVAPPPGITAPVFYLVDWRHVYDCNDNELSKNPYIKEQIIATYNPIKKQWVYIPHIVGIPGGEYDSYTAIPIHSIRQQYKDDEDVRTHDMKESGCCPEGLIPILPDYMWL